MLPGTDPLQPQKEAQGKASPCHRIADQGPSLHWMTAWEEQKPLEKAAMFVSTANTLTLLRSLHNTSFVISLLFESTDASLAWEMKVGR